MLLPRTRRLLTIGAALALLASCSSGSPSAETGSATTGGSTSAATTGAASASGSKVEQSAPPPGTAEIALAGEWHGTIDLPGQPLDIGLTFTEDGEVPAGTIDIPAQMIMAAPLSDVSLTGAAVTFAIADIPGNPTFAGTIESGRLSGSFTQNGAEYPFAVTPGPLPEPERPQEPQPPFPYVSEDVTVAAGPITLAGTLTRPDGPGPFTAVLMITGSGAQDRDETLAGHRPFLLLADTLTKAGYAVLRLDDRGVGGSTGDLNASTYQDLTADAADAVDFLQARPDVERVGLLGHSEGGYLAPLVAQQDPEVAFTVLMAGPAVPGDLVIDRQQQLLLAASGVPQDQIDAAVATMQQRTELLRAGDIAGAAAAARAYLEGQGVPADQIDAQLPSLVSPYMSSFLLHDPAPSLAALTDPVVAVYGGKDLQVPADQSVPPLTALLRANPDVTIATLTALNHLMQPADTGLPTEYQAIETTLDQEFLDLVSGWLAERFPAG